MWFKNIQAYRFTQPFSLDAQALSERLQEHAFKPCSSQDQTRTGWSHPLGRNGDDFVHASNGYIMLCSKRQDKLLPAVVINEELEDRISTLEESENRKVTRKERANLKEEIIFELLPRAFVRSSLQYAYISTVDNLLVINAASEKRADEFVTELRKAVGSLPVIPLVCKNQPIEAMSRWVADGCGGSAMVVGGECELRYDSDAASTIRCKNLDLASERILSHLQNGMHVAKLALTWNDRIEFVLDEKLTLKRLRFTEVVQEQIEKAEDPATQFDQDFSLMTLELSAFLKALIKAMGGEDTSEHAVAASRESGQAMPPPPATEILEAV